MEIGAAVSPAGGDAPEEDGAAGGGRSGPGTTLAALGSAALVCVAGLVCGLFYPVLKELRTETVRRPDGLEERLLGIWSIMLLSVVAGCVCSLLSWTLTYIKCGPPSRAFRDHHAYMDYGVALLNGAMAMLTVIWSLA